MILRIDLESEIPIYVQLRNQLVLGIAKGELEAGESLPSVRQMAADLGINMHTVNKAYAILRSEGLLAVHRREGVVVRRAEEVGLSGDFVRKLEAELEPSAAEAICRSMSEEKYLAVCAKVYRSIRGGK